MEYVASFEGLRRGVPGGDRRRGPALLLRRELKLALRLAGDEAEDLAVGLAEMRAAVGCRHGDDLVPGDDQPFTAVPGAEQPVVADIGLSRTAVASLAVDRSVAAARSVVGLSQVLVPVVVLGMAV